MGVLSGSALVSGFQDPDAVSSREDSQQKRLEQERSPAYHGLAQQHKRCWCSRSPAVVG